MVTTATATTVVGVRVVGVVMLPIARATTVVTMIMLILHIKILSV